MADLKAIKITDREASGLLNLEEGHFCDLKAKEIKPAKLSRSIAAFANAEGGELFVGIQEWKDTNTRMWDGFARQEDANGFIQLFDELFGLESSFNLNFLRNDNHTGWILKAEIQKSRDIKTASDGHIYVRKGAQNIPVTATEDVEKLKRAKGLTSFETMTIPVDADLITNSETIECRDFMSERSLRKSLRWELDSTGFRSSNGVHGG